METEAQDQPQSQTPQSQETNDPVKFSFLIAGEPEKKLDLDDTPTEAELSEERLAEEEWRSSRSIAGVPDREEESDEQQNEPKGEPEEKVTQEKQKSEPKLKVRRRKAKKTEPEPQPEPKAEIQEPKQPAENRQQDPNKLTPQEEALIDSLPESAKESIEFWRQAEEVDDKYKGYTRKQLNYIRELAKYTKKLRDEDPDTPLEQNAKYRAWVKNNKPSIPSREISRIKEEILINKAEKRLLQKQEPKLQEFEKWKRKQEIEKRVLPEYNQRSSAFASELTNSIAEMPEAEEPMKFFQEKVKETKDPGKALKMMSEEFPEEANIISQNYALGKDIVSNFLAARMGLVDKDEIDLREGTIHRTIADSIMQQERAMLEDPRLKKAQVREGKQFVPMAKFKNMNNADKAKHWTFSTDELVAFFKRETLARTKQQLKNHRQRVEKILSKYGERKKSSNDAVQSDNEDKPRYKGAESPSSSQRAANKGSDTSVGSRILNWDF